MSSLTAKSKYDAPPRAYRDAYCSPWCGFHCKRAAYDRAVEDGAALAARLGDGWESVVWENCGWHHSASKGCATVSPNVSGSKLRGEYNITGYTAFFNSTWQVVAQGSTPEDAIGFAIQDARTKMQKMADDCMELLS